MSNSALVVHTRLSPNCSPRTQPIDTITIHCVVGQATAESLGVWFGQTSTRASSNYGVDKDGRDGQYVDEAYRSWCTSSTANDNRAITIEVASDTYHPYAVSDKALAALIELCADICKRNNIKKLVWSTNKNDRVNHLNGCNMTVHRDYAAKACPGDYLYERHGYIADEVNKRLGATPDTLYRVRKAWDDSETQRGAFADIDKARVCAESNSGYSVYDPDGAVVYSPWSDGCPYGTTTSTVQNGTSGTAAYRCQWYLNELGYDVGDIDGMCGAVTVAAIKSFQTDKGLVVDGICGDNTWKALEYAYNAGLESEKEPEQGATDATEAALAWAVSTGLFIGTGNSETGAPDYAWKDFLTREQAALLFYRFAQSTGVV